MVKINRRKSLCACGCKQEVKFGNKYINHHGSSKNKPCLPKSPPQPCQCGCREMTKPGNKYILGHSNKLNFIIPEPNPEHLCECGCGEMVKWGKQSKKYNRFIKGHEHIGRKQSEEANRKRSESLKNIPRTEEWKKKIGIANTGKKHSKETKEKNSLATKEYYNNPENKKLQSERIKLVWSNPEYKNKMSGENSTHWKGGREYAIYGEEWSKQLREQIRERDNYQCQLCLTTQEESLVKYKKKLDVHHIDYNKENCSEDNLVSLCVSCHMKTNYNRDKWQVFLTRKHNNKFLHKDIKILKEENIVYGGRY